MRFLLLACMVLVAAAPATAATAARSVTLYLDGARVESEAVAVKGYLEVLLPVGVAEASLRVKPLPGASLDRVEIVPVRPDRKQEAEVTRLTERKEQLADRLRALEVREEIFRAAAKSQSAKAPRKSKTNREPMEEIRKGTEFAFAQLEEVYRGRRKAEDEMKGVERRLESLGKGGTTGGSVARLWFSGKNARAMVSYLQPALKWTPSYDIRLNGDKAEVILNALVPAVEKGAAVAVVPALLGELTAEPSFPAAADGRVRLASFITTRENEKSFLLPQPRVAFSFVNNSGKRLPPGEATCFLQGDYIGKTLFSGSLPGETRELEFGAYPVLTQPPPVPAGKR